MILFIIIMYKVEYVLFLKNSMKQKFTYIWINYRKESNFFFLNIDTDTNVWNFWQYLTIFPGDFSKLACSFSFSIVRSESLQETEVSVGISTKERKLLAQLVTG